MQSGSEEDDNSDEESGNHDDSEDNEEFEFDEVGTKSNSENQQRFYYLITYIIYTLYLSPCSSRVDQNMVLLMWPTQALHVTQVTIIAPAKWRLCEFKNQNALPLVTEMKNDLP